MKHTVEWIKVIIRLIIYSPFLAFLLGLMLLASPGITKASTQSDLNFASAYMSSNQNIDTSYGILNFDSYAPFSSTTTLFNTTTHAYTVPISGCYNISLSAFVYTGATPYINYIGFYVNSTEANRSYLHPFSYTGIPGEAYNAIQVQNVLCLNKGDTITAHGYGSPTATIIGGNTNTIFTIYQLDDYKNMDLTPLYISLAWIAMIMLFGIILFALKKS